MSREENNARRVKRTRRRRVPPSPGLPFYEDDPGTAPAQDEQPPAPRPGRRRRRRLEFDGVATYDHERDFERLNEQLWRVYTVLRDHNWHTLAEIRKITGDPTPSISARLRDLRKQKFGRHTIARRHVDRGLWEYRLAPDEPNETANVSANGETICV